MLIVKGQDISLIAKNIYKTFINIEDKYQDDNEIIVGYEINYRYSIHINKEDIAYKKLILKDNFNMGDIRKLIPKESLNITINCKDLNIKKPNYKIYFHILTIDIECININNDLHPYCVCLYDTRKGQAIHKYGPNCIKEIVELLATKEYNNTVIYAHNLAKFDFIYLIMELGKHDLTIQSKEGTLDITSATFKYNIKDKIYKNPTV